MKTNKEKLEKALLFFSIINSMNEKDIQKKIVESTDLKVALENSTEFLAQSNKEEAKIIYGVILDECIDLFK